VVLPMKAFLLGSFFYSLFRKRFRRLFKLIDKYLIKNYFH
jgi:hypothetical protein